jgi:hypothetical protein
MARSVYPQGFEGHVRDRRPGGDSRGSGARPEASIKATRLAPSVANPGLTSGLPRVVAASFETIWSPRRMIQVGYRFCLRQGNWKWPAGAACF